MTMRKVLIVDDEKWIRRGLIQQIPWEEYGLELAGEAGDGEEAYAMALDIKPDLMFLDMRMPGLDGKQLLGMLERELQGMITIVISGYSDFEYTKEAIRHSAFEYLLKPVKREELASVLERAVAELQRRDTLRITQNRSRGIQALQRLLFGGDRDAGEALTQLPEDWCSGRCAVIVAQPDLLMPAKRLEAFSQVLNEQLEREKPFLFGGQWDWLVTSPMDGSQEIIAVLCCKHPEQGDWQRLRNQLGVTAKQAGSESFSFGISLVKESPAQLMEAYHEAKLTLKSRRLNESGIIRSYAERPVSSAAVYPREQEQSFLMALRMGNAELAAVEFEQLFLAFTGETITVENMQRSAALLIHSLEKQLQAEDIRLDKLCGRGALTFTETIQQHSDAASIKGLFTENVIPEVLAHYGHAGEKEGQRIVREVQKLIEAHYDQTLVLQEIAMHQHMNPDYFSRLFKKTTGRAFVDYLTDTRIGKAKELLKDTNLKNYEIANKVGYEDYRYFSQIFKKKCGMTIGEYRDRQVGGTKGEIKS